MHLYDDGLMSSSSLSLMWLMIVNLTVMIMVFIIKTFCYKNFLVEIIKFCHWYFLLILFDFCGRRSLFMGGVFKKLLIETKVGQVYCVLFLKWQKNEKVTFYSTSVTLPYPTFFLRIHWCTFGTLEVLGERLVVHKWDQNTIFSRWVRLLSYVHFECLSSVFWAPILGHCHPIKLLWSVFQSR